ncbi:MAG: ribosomal protein L7/L12 [Opitutales bacterium]
MVESGESDETILKLSDALQSGRKIEAIKLCRELTGLGLKDAKEYVEKLEAELRKETPDAFHEAKGCMSVLALGFISTVTAIWAI